MRHFTAMPKAWSRLLMATSISSRSTTTAITRPIRAIRFPATNTNTAATSRTIEGAQPNQTPLNYNLFPMKISLGACFENGWSGRLARSGRRPADRTCAEPCCKKAVLIASNRCFRSVRRVAGRHRRVACAAWKPFSKHAQRPIKMSLALAFLIAAFPARATPVIGPWKPLFKGVDYSVSTNPPSVGDFPNLQVVHAFRVDLSDPDIRLLTTPRISNYAAGNRETGGLTVSDFLKTHHLQEAINANFFDPNSYYLPAGTPMDVYGLSISEGVVVSAQDGPNDASAILFDTNNQ